MESLARRGVRTTVAVAGLAALGVGLAAPAFAAPNFPDVSGLGNSSTAATDQQAGSSSEFAKASDALTTLPGKFNFEMPKGDSTTVPSDEAPSDTTPAPDATTPEAAAATPPSTDPTSGLPVAVPNVEVTPVSTADPGSALQALDSAGRFS